MTTESQPETPAVDGGEGSPRELREHAKRLEAENKAYRDTLLDQAFQLVGIDYTKPGLNTTMREGYTGEASREAILAYAKEKFEWEPPSEAGLSPPDQTNLVAAAISESQQRIGASQSQGGSERTPSIDDEIEAATKAGNFSEAIQLKLRKAFPDL